MSVLSRPPLIPPFPVRRFTVDEYHQMIDAGVLGEDDDVELLQGWIVPKMSRKPAHDSVLDNTRELIEGKILPPWRVRSQCAITTPDSEPEPDIALVRGPARRYH